MSKLAIFVVISQAVLFQIAFGQCYSQIQPNPAYTNIGCSNGGIIGGLGVGVQAGIAEANIGAIGSIGSACNNYGSIGNIVGVGYENIGTNVGVVSSGYGNSGQIYSEGYGNQGYGGQGNGELGIYGEIPVSGVTSIDGVVPVVGVVSFGGNIPASGTVSVRGCTPCIC